MCLQTYNLQLLDGAANVMHKRHFAQILPLFLLQFNIKYSQYKFLKKIINHSHKSGIEKKKKFLFQLSYYLALWVYMLTTMHLLYENVKPSVLFSGAQEEGAENLTTKLTESRSIWIN